MNKQKNYVTELCICTTLNFPVNHDTLQNSTKNIPKKTFGVFVGVYRSSLQELPSWPKDVHGCIGYYDKQFNIMQTNDIIEHMIQVSKDATYKDDRNKYFGPIYTDLYASYSVYFMTLPVMQINNKTGIIDTLNIPFNNSVYGLIYIDSQGHTATYLPGVFEQDKSWKYISNSLINKSGTSSGDTGNGGNGNGKFLAYKCIIFKDTLISILLNSEYTKYLSKTFIYDFILLNYNDFIPYKLNKNNEIIIDKENEITNTEIINTLLYLEIFIHNALVFEEKLITPIIENINYYLNKYVNNTTTEYITAQQTDNTQKLSTQTEKLLKIAPNLMTILNKLQISTRDERQKSILQRTMNIICQNTSKILFEQPQQHTIILANLITMSQLCKFNNQFDIYQQKLFEIETNKTNTEIGDIFRINTTIKFLYFMKKYFNKFYGQNIELLLQKYSNIIQIIYDNMDKINTHFLSNAFECSCVFVLLLIDNQQQINMNLRNNVFILFYFLQQRTSNINGKYVGLYKQLNGDVLINVTCDILRGLLALNGYLLA